MSRTVTHVRRLLRACCLGRERVLSGHENIDRARGQQKPGRVAEAGRQRAKAVPAHASEPPLQKRPDNETQRATLQKLLAKRWDRITKSSLAYTDPVTYTAFMEDQRQATGENHLVHDSDRYPLCGRGDVNPTNCATRLLQSSI